MREVGTRIGDGLTPYNHQLVCRPGNPSLEGVSVKELGGQCLLDGQHNYIVITDLHMARSALQAEKHAELDLFYEFAVMSANRASNALAAIKMERVIDLYLLQTTDHSRFPAPTFIDGILRHAHGLAATTSALTRLQHYHDPAFRALVEVEAREQTSVAAGNPFRLDKRNAVERAMRENRPIPAQQQGLVAAFAANITALKGELTDQA